MFKIKNLPAKSPSSKFDQIVSLDAHHRLIASLVCAALSFAVLYFLNFQWASNAVASWDVFAFFMLLLSWTPFLYSNPKQIRQKVKGMDSSQSFAFILVIVASFSSLFSVLILLNNNNLEVINRQSHTALSILAVALSWGLVHTVFTFRYAHKYYSDSEEKEDQHAGGLDFPMDDMPDYMDFAYFSFVIGMTFQVSDVTIKSRDFRQLVLVHSLLSFVFNTVIVALSINIIANL